MKNRTVTSSSSLIALAAALALSGVGALGAEPSGAATPAAAAQAPEAGKSPTGLGVLADRPDAPSADAPPTDAADAPLPESGDLLGVPYQSRGAGISLRAPAGSKTVRKSGGEEIVEFSNEKRRWALKVMLITTQQPIGLLTTTDATGRETRGLMDITKDRVARALPEGATAERRFLREDVVNIADGIPSEDPRLRIPNVGMLALRYTKGLERLLGQQAIIQANERTYYLVTMVSPGKPIRVTKQDPAAAAPAAKPPAPAPDAAAGDDEPVEPLDQADPNERLAVEAFRQVIDSVKLLDRSKLKQEQDERLFATRALYVNFNAAHFKTALRPKQWYRLIRKGKDIGFVYTMEEFADGIPQERPKEGGADASVVVAPVATGETGVLVRTRSRIIMEATKLQVDAESLMFVTMNRSHEDWSSLIVTTDPATGKKDHVTEFGTSDLQGTRALDRGALERGIRGEDRGPNKVDANQPPVRESRDYLLNVTHVAKGGNAEPINRALPPFYLPQALSKMLPRLVDTRAVKSGETKKYMFMQYVGDSREVMTRYVDVEPVQRVTFAGRAIRAIPVRDKITLDGPVTTHYLSEAGEYLGSESPDSGVAVIPTDEKTLNDLWKDADFSRPAAAPAPPAAAAATIVPRAPRPSQAELGNPHGSAGERLPATPRRPQPR